ncbi:Uncharacterised protein [Flavonifractor plautii]|uniref:Uncharacterized protein n=1 Tax=Flavonifractor plautii TaxID=292800 RepID=A0A174VG79_FLAPL|nr:Uncharacterised protein [Flavonifractor plautii]
MGAQVGQGGGPAAEVLRDGAGFQGAQPHPALRRGGAHRLHKVDQALPIFEIVSPGGDFDAGEHQLPVARPGKALCLTGGLPQGKGADRPPGVGDNTVGAEVDAAVLHLEHGPGARASSTLTTGCPPSGLRASSAFRKPMRSAVPMTRSTPRASTASGSVWA